MPRRCRGPRAGASGPRRPPPTTVTRPPAGVWRSALATRLASTSRIRTGSISSDRQVAVDRPPSVTPAAAAAGSNERTTSATRRSGSVGSGWRASVPGLGQGERPQVVDQPAEDARLVEDRAPRCVRVGRIDAVDDRLEVALDDGQRRPQLVADVGEQRPALALVGLEPLGHRVEADVQLVDQARPARRRRLGRRPGRSSRRPRPGAWRRPAGRACGR